MVIPLQIRCYIVTKYSSSLNVVFLVVNLLYLLVIWPILSWEFMIGIDFDQHFEFRVLDGSSVNSTVSKRLSLRYKLVGEVSEALRWVLGVKGEKLSFKT